MDEDRFNQHSFKQLSEKRKSLHTQLELIEKNIQNNYKKIETMRIVGSDVTEVMEEIENLILQGERVSFEIHHLENEIRLARQAESESRSEM